MSQMTVGTFASTTLLKRRSSEIRSQMTQLGNALLTGRVDDIRSRLGGDFRGIGAIERGLRLADSYGRVLTESASTAGSMQASLDAVGSGIETLARTLAGAVADDRSRSLTFTGRQALTQLRDAIAQINTRHAGRALFAGAGYDGTALKDADTILSGLKAAVTAAAPATAREALDAIDAWFTAASPAAGFETEGYAGSDIRAGSIRIGETETVSLDIQAFDPALRKTLCALAGAALLADPDFLTDAPAGRDSFAEISLGRLREAGDAMTGLRASLGATRERIEEREIANRSETVALEIARAELLDVDPYETAIEFQACETQLETLYALTARLSKLTLTNYL